MASRSKFMQKNIIHPHVHVLGKGFEARFDLNTLELLTNTGFSRADIKKIRDHLQVRLISLKEMWNEYNQ
jgi:Domain of unknown function (DUF4160)